MHYGQLENSELGNDGGYYLAARRYKVFLRVLKRYFRSERSIRVKIFQHEERNFITPSDHEMSFLLYKILAEQ